MPRRRAPPEPAVAQLARSPLPTNPQRPRRAGERYVTGGGRRAERRRAHQAGRRGCGGRGSGRLIGQRRPGMAARPGWGAAAPAPRMRSSVVLCPARLLAARPGPAFQARPGGARLCPWCPGGLLLSGQRESDAFVLLTKRRVHFKIVFSPGRRGAVVSPCVLACSWRAMAAPSGIRAQGENR